jgi:hypothetical protein
MTHAQVGPVPGVLQVDPAPGVLQDRSGVASFVAGIRGEVLRPGAAAYDEARTIWNGMIDRRPAVIVRCTGTADVIACVNFAREEGSRSQFAEADTTLQAARSAMTG